MNMDRDLAIQSGGNTYLFNIEELRALYRIFWKQYIDYEDEQAHIVANKVSNIIENYDKQPRTKK